jgi:hypothetical protein|tara:strand:- start:531 stop:1067 length:537 start_codon:yes stop_codon:yes gene_type:complete
MNNLNIVGHNTKKDRIDYDFYPTPEIATLKLLEKESFKGNIWECACGDGAISKILKSKNYEVFSSDIVFRDYGEKTIDFLNSKMIFDNIITNPPFKLSLEFALHGLKSVKNKMVLFQKLVFLEGIKRKKELFSLNKLKNIYVISNRLKFKGYKTGGLMCFAWFIFDVNYNGKPTIDWI